MKTLTVYRKHPCIKCDMTIKTAEKLGYNVKVLEIFDANGDMLLEPKALYEANNFMSAPIVVLSDDKGTTVDVWSDFRIDKLNKYK